LFWKDSSIQEALILAKRKIFIGRGRVCITDPMHRYVPVYCLIRQAVNLEVNRVAYVLSQTHVDERLRDSRRIFIDELVSQMNVINGAKTLYCEVVGRWTRSI
jgi:phosphatidylglycerophosphatase A